MDKTKLKQRSFLNKLDITVKKSKNKTKNTRAVAQMLGLPSNLDYDKQCSVIIAYLYEKSIDNHFVKEMLETIGYSENVCEVLVDVLYELFRPDSLPKKAPISISEKKYQELLNKKKQNIISEKENTVLMEALNCKYCYCVKQLYLKNMLKQFITDKPSKYNSYAICTSSIYKNRGIKPPERVSYSCREKYDWYKKN